jgi:3-hydroxymyristoyl/3-hydroxydecanoyl-(acyl carrier protein) dehydratase
VKAVAASPLAAVDSVDLPGGGVAVGHKLVRADEPYLSGHYPGFAIFPGVFIVEAACQVVAAHVAATRPAGWRGAMIRIDSVRFQRLVVPGDRLTVRVECAEADDDAGAHLTARADIRVDGDRPAARMSMRFRLGPDAPGGPGIEAAPVGRADVSHPAVARPDAAYPNVADLLPHRPPILLVDRIAGFTAPDAAVVERLIRPDEPCFAAPGPLWSPGAGPGDVYPPTLVLESFAQSCGVLWQLHARHSGAAVEGLLVFGAARKVAYHRPVRAGEVLRHEVHLQQVYDDTAIVTGRTTAGGELVATVESATALMRTVPALAASRT